MPRTTTRVDLVHTLLMANDITGTGGRPSTDVIIDGEGGRLYPCGWCNENWKTNSQRRRHELTHSDATPYVCEYCGEGFKRREAMKSHELQHLHPKQPKVTPLKTPKRKKAAMAKAEMANVAMLRSPKSSQRVIPPRQCKQHQSAYVDALASNYDKPRSPGTHGNLSSLATDSVVPREASDHAPTANSPFVPADDAPRRHSAVSESTGIPTSPLNAPSQNTIAADAPNPNPFTFLPYDTSFMAQSPDSLVLPVGNDNGLANGHGDGVSTVPSPPTVRIQWACRPTGAAVPTRPTSVAPMSTSTFNALTQSTLDKDDYLPGPEFYDWINTLLSLPGAQETLSGELAGEPSATGERALTPAFPCNQDATACARLCKWLECGAGEWGRCLSSARFTRCLKSYWDHIDVEWQIIHRPSFMPSAESELLLYAVIIAGAAYSDDECDRVWAEGAFPSARGLAMSSDAGDRKSLLPILQCNVLLSIAGQAMGRKQQRAGHALIGAALVLARREFLYEGRRTEPPRLNVCDVPAMWNRWILEESLKRVAWAILMRDIGYASFFSELPSRAMSPFYLPVELPCSDECWEALTSDEWKAHKPDFCGGSHTNGATLAEVLANDLSSAVDKNKELQHVSPFARLILMYAFIALGWDTNRRDMIASEIFKSPGGVAGLNQFLLQKFASATLREGNQANASRSAQCLEETMGDISLLAFLDLHVQLMRLQVFIGSTEAGQFRPFGPAEHVQVCDQVYNWLPSQTASTCVELSAKYLSQVIRGGHIRTVTRAWAVYHAFLMCWIAYWTQRAPRSTTHRAHIKEDALLGCDMLVTWARGGNLPLWTNVRALAIETMRLLSARREPIIVNACAVMNQNGMV